MAGSCRSSAPASPRRWRNGSWPVPRSGWRRVSARVPRRDSTGTRGRPRHQRCRARGADRRGVGGHRCPAPGPRRQLTWTLTQLPEVTSVRLQVGGEPYDVPGVPELMDRSVWQERSRTVDDGSDRHLASALLRARWAGSDPRLGGWPNGSADEGPRRRGADRPGGGAGPALSGRVEPDRRALWILPLDRGIAEQRIEGTRSGAPASTSTAGHGSPMPVGHAAGPQRVAPGGRGPARSRSADHVGPSRPRRDPRRADRRRGSLPGRDRAVPRAGW